MKNFLNFILGLLIVCFMLIGAGFLLLLFILFLPLFLLLLILFLPFFIGRRGRKYKVYSTVYTNQGTRETSCRYEDGVIDVEAHVINKAELTDSPEPEANDKKPSESEKKTDRF